MFMYMRKANPNKRRRLVKKVFSNIQLEIFVLEDDVIKTSNTFDYGDDTGKDPFDPKN